MIATSALHNNANAITIKASEGNTTSETSCPAKVQKDVISPKETVKTIPSPAELKQRIVDVSQKYGLDYDQLYSVVECESQFKPQYGDSGLAYGVAQFHKPTFNQYCDGDYYNNDDQLDCMGKMFSIGQAKQWSCFKNLYTQVIYHDYARYYQLAIAQK